MKTIQPLSVITRLRLFKRASGLTKQNSTALGTK